MTTKFVSETVYADFEFNDSIDMLIKELNTLQETALNCGMVNGDTSISFNNTDDTGWEIIFNFKRKETNAERIRRERFEAAEAAKLASAKAVVDNAERAEYERLKAKFG